MRILVTGSRLWTDEDMIRNLLAAIDRQEVPEVLDALGLPKEPAHTLVHGGARGADTIAGSIAKELGWTVEAHWPAWRAHPKDAALLNNQKMVGLGADMCMGFLKARYRSSLAEHCMRAARMAGITVAKFYD